MAYTIARKTHPEKELEKGKPIEVKFDERSISRSTSVKEDIYTVFHDMQPHPGTASSLKRYMRPIKSNIASDNHKGTVSAVSILLNTAQEDGSLRSLLITGSEDGTAKLWDLFSGAFIATFAGHGWHAEERRSMKIFTVTSHTFSSEHSLNSLVATGAEDSTAIIWRLDGSKMWHFNSSPQANGEKIHTGSISTVLLLDLSVPVLAISCHDKTCSVWSLVSGFCLYKFADKVHTDLINNMTYFMESGRELTDLTLITAGWDKTVVLWNLKDSSPHDQFPDVLKVQPHDTKLLGHKKSVTTITAQMVCMKDQEGRSREYPIVVTGSLDKTAIVWDKSTGEQITVLEGHKEKINAVRVVSSVELSLSAPPLVLTASDDKTIILWDIMTAIKVRTLTYSAKIMSLAALSTVHGPLIVSGGVDKLATVWDLTASVRIRKLSTGAVTGIGTYESKEGNTKVIIGDVLNKSTVFDLASGEKMKELQEHTARLNFLVTYCPADSNRTAFITCASDATAKVWDMNTLTCRSTFKKHDKLVFALAVYDPEMCNPESIGTASELSFPMAITGGLDKDIRFWDLRVDGDPTDSTSIIPRAHNGFVRAMAVYHPKIGSDTPLLVSGSYDLTAKIWDLKTKKCLKTLRGHTDYVFLISIYDPFEHMGVEKAEQEEKTSAWVITGSYDKTVMVWDIRSGHLLKTLRGHKDSITAMDLYVPKSATEPPLLVTGSIDTLVIVWNLFTGEPLQTLVGHTDRVCFICIHQPREGGYPLILSGSDDKCTIIWEDALYSTAYMPLRDSVNRMFEADSLTQDWPLITEFARKYRSSLFMENTNLFYMAIDKERPDFLLKFRKYLSVCVRHTKRFEYEGSVMGLLEYALHRSDLISVKAILLCWLENLNADVFDLLAQNVFHACYFFPPLKDLVPLSKKYPLEYLQFIAAIRLVRNHPTLLEDVKDKSLNQKDRYEIAGTNSRQAHFSEVWLAHFKKDNMYDRLVDVWCSIFSRAPPAAQPVTSLFLPVRYCADLWNGFGVFADVCNQLDSVEIFDSAIGIFAVQYFWLRYTRAMHIRSMLIYLASHIFFMFFIYSYQFYYEPGRSVGGDVGMAIFMILVILSFLYYIWEEYKQMLELHTQRMIEGENAREKLTWVKALSHFGQDLWNVVDLCICVSGVTGIIIVAASQGMGTVARCLLASCSVLMWFKILYFLRPFSTSGPLGKLGIFII
ncbi:hypothetical protein EON65_15020 [archaeon]|nr:MAG: hypothetical protein EON65_15020 [archaeon]